MPPREPLPLSLWSERPDYAGSSHRNGDLIPRPLVRQQQPGSWAPFRNPPHARTIWRPQRQWWPVVLQEVRSPSASLTCRELSFNWMSSLTWSSIIGPTMRDRARRPVARDSNGRSLMRQLFRVFRRPFPTFLGPAHDLFPLSGLHGRASHGIQS